MRRIKLRKSRRQSGRTLILHDARNDLVLITADTVIDHAAILDAHRDRIQQFGRFAIESRRSEEHTSELQSLMRISYAVFCLKKKKTSTEKKQNDNERPTAKTSTTRSPKKCTPTYETKTTELHQTQQT